ncbi:HAMP domain-containing sensor histidine kinase [Pseudonocardia sp.]|uniref:sensor histidine kinase n=1 Tax=Pseudonocardia sp. TaxID=60912 RepID=UPI0031FC01B5
MRARLLFVLTLVGLLVVTAFSVPLGLSMAESRTRAFVLSRNADLERFAALADAYVRGDDPGTVLGELQTYRDLYGEEVGVVSTRGAAPYPEDFDQTSRKVAEAVSRALRNQADPLAGVLTPWSPDDVVFAKATGTDAQITGAVVLVASSEAARSDIRRYWLLIAGGGFVVLGVLIACAVGVSRWILRPVGVLSDEMRVLASGLPRAGGVRAEILPAGRAVDRSTGPPELREMTRTFALMAQLVRRSTEAQRRLVADTAHQLRNPLAALQLRLDSLNGRVDASAETGYERAVSEAERLADILDGLLVLSKAEVAEVGGDTAGMTPETCAPWLVVSDRVDAWQDSAVRAGVALRAAEEREPGLVAAIGHDDLAQVLDVLLDNACRYAGPGALVTVDVGRTAPGTVEVTVADTGRGVPDDELGRITERFYRGTSASVPGTGLGLSIVDALVVGNGGGVEVRSPAGGGLTVTVRLVAADERVEGSAT